MLVLHESPVTFLDSLNLVISEACFHVKYLEAQPALGACSPSQEFLEKQIEFRCCASKWFSSSLSLLLLSEPLLHFGTCLLSELSLSFSKASISLSVKAFRLIADSVFGGIAQFVPNSRVPAPKKLRVRTCAIMRSPPRAPHFAVTKAKWRYLENKQLTTTIVFLRHGRTCSAWKKKKKGLL